VVVEAGELRLRVGERVVGLGVGDSAYFEADQEHGFANPGEVPCVYHVAALIMRSRG
jgi:mannose-6-phosphate isomerase-like protein (cupin superfamily)